MCDDVASHRDQVAQCDANDGRAAILLVPRPRHALHAARTVVHWAYNEGKTSINR